MLQSQAFDLLKMGKNIFLTGAAGAGKTYLLNQYIKYLKDCKVGVAITASTGIAATHLRGTTIHSWSGIGVKDALTNQDLEKLLTNQRVKRNFKNTKVLIIDEISMLHKHQLDMVDKVARYMLECDQPFGGMQVVLCGDFFQLPPVSSNNNGAAKQFAYEADIWQQGDFHICYLHEQHRQTNDPLLNVLNDIRSGTAGEHTKVPLRTRYKKEPSGAVKATRLYSRNINVDYINEQELSQITGKEQVFDMESEGWEALVDGLKRSCLAPQQLKLKIGAEVMFIKNHNAGEFVNGTRAIVTEFDEDSGWPIVKTYDNDTIIASPEDWTYEENGVVRATISQVPLRLAWAITIHKSQGMTLDAAEIDLGDAFEPGMGYVALSRVRKLDGLKLMNLNEMALKVHPQILQQDKIFQADSDLVVEYLSGLAEEQVAELQLTTLKERFGGKFASAASAPVKSKKSKAKPTKEKPVASYIVTLSHLKNGQAIAEIAAERNLSSNTILTHIEKLRGLKMLDKIDLLALKESIPYQEFSEIYDEFLKSTDGKLQPIYDKLAEKYSYEQLRVVRLFMG